MLQLLSMKHLVLCIRAAPRKPRAMLCLVPWKHSSVNPLPARNKRKMAWDWLPVGCGAVWKKLPPAHSQRDNSAEHLWALPAAQKEKSRKRNKFDLILLKRTKGKRDKSLHFKLGKCLKLIDLTFFFPLKPHQGKLFPHTGDQDSSQLVEDSI